MTLYTSDIKPEKETLKVSFIYMLVSVFLAAAGAVYEYFSHGVYSNFMIYAFAIPLVMGALLFMIMKLKGRDRVTDGLALNLYHSAIATLTIGSIMQGVLSIYGTSNRLIVIYPAAGLALIAAAAVTAAAQRRTRSTMTEAAPTAIPAAIPLKSRTGK